MTPDEIQEHARDLLEANSYVVLGTADDDGHPWVTPVWFAPDGLDRLYWLSWPGSRHSVLVERRPRIALTVFDSRVEPNHGAAFYATADAQPCPEELMEAGLGAVNRRSTSQGLATLTRERVSGPARLRLYVAAFTERWVLDQDAEVDQRVAVP
jgi:hypothetical protein